MGWPLPRSTGVCSRSPPPGQGELGRRREAAWSPSLSRGAVAGSPPPFLAATPRLTCCQRSTADGRLPVRSGASPRPDLCLKAPREPQFLAAQGPQPRGFVPKDTEPPWRWCWVSSLGWGCCWRLGMAPSTLTPRKDRALQHREASSPKCQQGRQGGPRCHRMTEAAWQPCPGGIP